MKMLLGHQRCVGGVLPLLEGIQCRNARVLKVANVVGHYG